MTLEDDLKQLHALAVERPGHGVRIWIRSLAVELAWHPDWTTLILFRDGYYPTEDDPSASSGQALRRVLESLPYRLPFLVTPVLHREDGTCYVITEWPTVEAQ